MAPREPVDRGGDGVVGDHGRAPAVAVHSGTHAIREGVVSGCQVVGSPDLWGLTSEGIPVGSCLLLISRSSLVDPHQVAGPPREIHEGEFGARSHPGARCGLRLGRGTAHPPHRPHEGSGRVGAVAVAVNEVLQTEVQGKLAVSGAEEDLRR